MIYLEDYIIPIDEIVYITKDINFGTVIIKVKDVKGNISTKKDYDEFVKENKIYSKKDKVGQITSEDILN
jgi:hypothetical protein